MSFGYAYDSPFFQETLICGDGVLQVTVDAVGLHVAKSNNNNTRQSGSTCRDNLSEVQVMREKNTFLVPRLFQYFRIRKPVKALLMQMHSVVSHTCEKRH